MDKAFHRRIVAIPEAGVVRAALEDEMHHMEVHIFHDGETVTDVQSFTYRIPWNTCPGATEKLKDLIGVPLQRMHRSTGLDAKEHCTHLFDLARIAMARAYLKTPVQYDGTVPDHSDGRFHAELLRDGKPILAWELHDATVTGPELFKGHKMIGPPQWAAGLDDDTIEAALVLRRTIFVSGVRGEESRSMERNSRTDEDFRQALRGRGMLGHCYTYRLPRFEQASRHHTQQDYAGRQDDLLAGFMGTRTVAAMAKA